MTEKQTFLTKRAAKRAIRRITGVRGVARPCRAYRCPFCGWWHMTSSTKTEYQERISA